jgi:subtilisin-like proprotein convertase family protein
MHSTDWNHDSSGNVTFADTDHYVATQPIDLIGSEIAISYNGFGDSDAMVPTSDAVDVAQWTEYPSDASVIAYDPNPAPEGGQIVFFAFNYAAAGEGRMDLLQNAVIWLLTPEFGTSGVQGTVLLAGQDDHSGITVRANPGGGEVTTGPDGSYSIEGLYAGTYDIVASKDNWSTAIETVTLAEGEILAGVDMVLTPVTTTEYCDTPGAAINDNQSTSVTIEIPAEDDAVISEMEVFLDITHTYIGDLEVTLSSPCQTTVVLHNRGGGSSDDIYGWYPDELAPDGDLDQFVGLTMAGEWTLEVTDNAGGDTGTINEWCMRITHDTVVSVDDPGVPGGSEIPVVFKAYDNYPNPFNPMTNIKFDLPRSGHVELAVYDLAGRLVRELVNEDLGAATHTVRWDGTDQSGRRQASGVYYYRLVTDERTVTKKMTLVK